MEQTHYQSIGYCLTKKMESNRNETNHG